MLVSVLIPTVDRPTSLVRCVESVLRSRYSSFEVIVLDQSPIHDDSETMFDSRLVSFVRLGARGKALALNYGLSIAKGDVLALVDDDIEVRDDWLSLGAAALMRSSRTALVFGTVAPCPHDCAREFVPVFMPERARLVTNTFDVALPGIGMGANMFAKTKAVAAIGGWDQHLGPGSRFRSGDDWDIAFRAVRAGFAVAIEPAVTVTHWGARAFDDHSASKLINNNYYGIGAGLAKYSRIGGTRSSRTVASAVSRCMVKTLQMSCAARRPRGVGRLAAMAAGFSAGWTFGLDRDSMTFSQGSDADATRVLECKIVVPADSRAVR